LLPWFFFLLNLQTLLHNVNPANRRMSPGLVWLNFIPVFELGWFIYTVIKVKQSLEAELRARAWFVDDDLGYNVGLTAGILWVASFFIGWIPFIGWVLPVAGIICWIIYWLKTSDLKTRLDSGPAWSRAPYASQHPPVYPPYPLRPAQSRGPQAGGAESQDAPGTDRKPPEAESPGEETVEEAHESEVEPPDLRCPYCGAHFDPGDWFCRKCGSRLY
jgi:hypothetical protein